MGIAHGKEVCTYPWSHRTFGVETNTPGTENISGYSYERAKGIQTEKARKLIISSSSYSSPEVTVIPTLPISVRIDIPYIFQ